MSAAEKVVKLDVKTKRNKLGRLPNGKWTEEMKDKARATRAAKKQAPAETSRYPSHVRKMDAKLYLADAERRLAQIELPVKASRQMKIVRALLTLAVDSLEG